MPRQVLPDEKSFADFKEKILALEFRELTNEEFTAALERSDFKPSSSSAGRSTAFVYSADRPDKPNDLKVFAWTTYLSQEQKSRATASGWILITQAGQARYFAHPLMRTKNFLITLVRLAWIARWRVINRPTCRECQRYMKIAYGWAIKSRYWRCDYRSNHHSYKSIFEDWDIGMPPKAFAFVKKRRKVRRKYREGRKRAGKPNNVAMLNRLKRKRRRLKNLTSSTT
ncbi:MAG: hypothetical protein NTY31_02650 [Candidatus Falkowbacteria bacterium]|nr:hypothetical protein [Candidatus Falkowbacteria bacterium]